MSEGTNVQLSTSLPDLVAAVYGNGTAEVRVRGTNDVIVAAPDTAALTKLLRSKFPDGFMLDVRYDPHM